MRVSPWPAGGNCGLWTRDGSGGCEFRDLHRVDAFDAPGAEPLTIGPEAFVALFHGRRLAIKAALLNQKLLAGVGNIYADESLFRAGVRPRRRTARLTKVELERLRLALREVLHQAIRARRLVGFGLCGCRRGKRLFSTGAQGVPTDRPAMPCVRDADSTDHRRRTKYTLLSALPAVATNVWFLEYSGQLNYWNPD